MVENLLLSDRITKEFLRKLLALTVALKCRVDICS